MPPAGTPPARQHLESKSRAQRFRALKRALGTHARLGMSALAVLAISGALLGYFLTGSSSPALITGSVTIASISQAITASGTIVPTKEEGLYFSDAGIVQSVTATPGEKVKAGEALASLDITPLEIQLAEAQANLASAQAKLESDEAGASPTELASAQGAVASAENSLQQAEASLPFTEQSQQSQLNEQQTTLKIDQQKLVEDEQTLSNDKAITQGWCQADPSSSECSQAITALTQAQAQVTSDQQDLQTAENQLAQTKTKNAEALNQAQESVTSAQNALDQAENNANFAQQKLSEAQTIYNQDQGQYTTCEQKPPSSGCSSLAQQLLAAQANLTAEEQSSTQAEQEVTDDQDALSNAESSLGYTQQLDQESLQAAQDAVSNAQTKLSQDQATLNQDEAIADGGCSADPTSSECSSATSALTTAENAVQADQQALESLQVQLPASDISEEQALRQAQNQIKADELQVQNTQANLAAVKQSVTPQQLQADAASVREATTQLQADEANLEGAVIKAPSSGTVAEVNLTRGENTPAGGVSGGGTPAAPKASSSSALGLLSAPIVFFPSSRFSVSASVTDTDIQYVRAGEHATVMPSGSTKPLQARVTTVQPEATVTDGVATYPIAAAIVSPPSNLFAGESAIVSITIHVAYDVEAVPTSAVHGSGRHAFVFVEEQGREHKKRIVLGISNGIYTQVIAGLEKGEQVILAKKIPPPSLDLNKKTLLRLERGRLPLTPGRGPRGPLGTTHAIARK